MQVTTFASWEDIGRWYGGLQKDPLEVTAPIEAKAAELTNGLTTDDDKIHAISNFVSVKYHYIGLDFGIGRYQPYAADDVLDNGYGDCKDKHTLLASLLKAAGIEAWPVLIHSHRKLDPDVPSPAQFYHVITAVPRGDTLLWLDTTPEVAPIAAPESARQAGPDDPHQQTARAGDHAAESPLSRGTRILRGRKTRDGWNLHGAHQAIVPGRHRGRAAKRFPASFAIAVEMVQRFS